MERLDHMVKAGRHLGGKCTHWTNSRLYSSMLDRYRLILESKWFNHRRGTGSYCPEKGAEKEHTGAREAGQFCSRYSSRLGTRMKQQKR